MSERWATSKEDLVQLGDVLDLLKSKGVSGFNGFGIAVTFASEAKPQSESELQATLKNLIDAPPMCKCGHEMTSHQDGFCIAGCAAEKCAPKE